VSIPLPLFLVRWGEWDNPSIKVTILGTTKELLELRQEDVSFSKRPKFLVHDAESLLAIPDSRFGKLSKSERIDLLERHAPVEYKRSSNKLECLELMNRALGEKRPPR